MDQNQLLKKNFLSISLIRLFCPTMVFIYHVLVGYTNIDDDFRFLYYAVQIFLFISGFLYGGKKQLRIKDFYIKTAKRILTPLIVVVIIFALSVGAFKLFGIDIPLSTKLETGTKIYVFSHLWYVYGILLCYLLTPLIHALFYESKINKTFALVFLLIACLINLLITPFYLRLVLPSYIFGYFVRNYKDKFSRCLRITVSTLMLAVGILIYLIALSVNILHLHNMMKEVSGFLCANGVCVLTITCAEYFKPRSTPLFLRLSDKFSYTFYLWHHAFLLGGYSVLYSTLKVWQIGLIAYAFTIVLAVITELLTNYILSISSKIKAKKNIN